MVALDDLLSPTYCDGIEPSAAKFYKGVGDMAECARFHIWVWRDTQNLEAIGPCDLLCPGREALIAEN